MEMSAVQIIIDPEFKALIPPIKREEREQLEANIVADGCREPLVVWQQTGILLDGHNRYEICGRRGVEFGVREIALDDRDAAADWVDRNQLGRRNLDPDQMSLLRGRRYNRTKKTVGGTGANQHVQKGQSVPSAETLAVEHGVSGRTIKRDGQFAEAVDKLKSIDPEIEHRVVMGEAPPKSSVIAAAQLLERAPDRAAAILAGKAKLAVVKKEIKREEVRQEMERAAEVLNIEKPDVSDRYRLYHGDLKHVAAQIDECSVDWIITDPPYPKDFLHVYSDLSKFAARVLRPGGSVICMVGQSYLPDIINRLGESLNYHWALSYATPGGQAVQLWERKVNTFWKPLLWFVKGEYSGRWIGDVCKSGPNDNDKRFHNWGQSESGMADIVERFTKPGDVICDPFLGGGTTGIVALKIDRQFIGIDVDEKAIGVASGRIKVAF